MNRDLPEFVVPPDGVDPTGTCPRCQHASAEILRTRCCAACGYAWPAPSEPDDPDLGACGGGGAR